MAEAADRMPAFLAEVEAQLLAARDHEDFIAAAMEESAAWPLGEARAWVAAARSDATSARSRLEVRLAAGNAIAARAAEGTRA